MMAGIRSINTKPELTIRKALHRRGFRYRLHLQKLTGRPDLVFPAHKALIFVHGCFWHGHDCSFYRTPKTRADFWLAKIETNQKRDAKVMGELYKSGWRQLVIWECAIRGKKAEAVKVVIDKTEKWIRSKRRFAEIRGP
jgi:DNA mismatch endonuclease (patch repair protein)